MFPTAESTTAHTVLAWIAVAALACATVLLAAALLRPHAGGRPARPDQRAVIGDRDAFHHAIDEATHADATVAVILINLDRSRQLISRLGDRGFDQYLVLVGGRLQHLTAAAGAAAFRMRRDEFAVIVAAEAARPLALANKLLAAVAEPTDVHIGHRQANVEATACAGIAISAPGTDTARITLAHADRALQHAKTRGRGRVATIADAVRREGPAGGQQAGPAASHGGQV
ncbi:diguanylate cyclase (GGDEF)-like protein [Asanoa ferruginea]|uniref:Diguanylate cyclase (GGDEF)-like protein n=1 Tax=Asanoa ferruginea TaxID=53367 RepID=A0A3D9ZUN5_9ACTN|nr:diguanylate cyclase [Asanoa ferruginea]REG00916.1 diguanylate cyclase (GGDEF)-like protein [Asanoa ferruginea]GIF47499.1 hypothetical protein Afe04nite_20380 [Asanoa ferruginea]